MQLILKSNKTYKYNFQTQKYNFQNTTFKTCALKFLNAKKAFAKNEFVFLNCIFNQFFYDIKNLRENFLN